MHDYSHLYALSETEAETVRAARPATSSSGPSALAIGAGVVGLGLLGFAAYTFASKPSAAKAPALPPAPAPSAPRAPTPTRAPATAHVVHAAAPAPAPSGGSSQWAPASPGVETPSDNTDTSPSLADTAATVVDAVVNPVYAGFDAAARAVFGGSSPTIGGDGGHTEPA